MKRLAVSVFGAAVALTLFVSAPQKAEARMQYYKEFESLYKDKLKDIDTKKCGICHGKMGNDKKKVSDYGKELGTALGAKNVKDVDKIKDAFKAIEAKDAGSGKTYGDLLKDGQYPAPAAD